MNKMKRVFSLVLAFAIVLGTFGSFAPVFAAEAKTETKVLREVPKDVIGTEYEDAVRRLVAFGIIGGYPDGTYKPEDVVNRAQFAKIIVEALGLKDAVPAANQSSTGFSDVYDGHWATGYINVASGQGLITGYPDGTFKAEQDVTYAEALTMLVRALGYRDEFLQGNWPGNYISKAADAGITRGVNIPVNAQVGAQRGYIANLVNNALDAKVVKVDKYTQGRVDYYETDIPLLKDKLEISKYEDTRIIADKIVDDGLRADEIRVRFLKDTPGYEKRDRYDRGEIVKEVYGAGDHETFDFDNNVTPREVIGEEVTTYVNDKDVVIYVERENDDKAHFDFVEKIKNDKLDLVKFDREYDFEISDKNNRADVAVVYNFDAKDNRFDVLDSISELKDLDKKELVGRMGKVVVRNNRIVYAEFLNPAEVNDWMVVLKNDKGLVEGVSGETDEFKLDLRKDKDYDYALAFNTKGEAVELEDIKEGNVLYVQEQKYDGDDVAVVTVVQDNVVDGEVGRVKTDRIEIGGKEIKVVKSKDNDDKNVYYTTYSVDELDEIKSWNETDEWEDDMEDAYKQESKAYLDGVGRIAFLRVGGGDSGYKFGIVTRTYADGDRIRIYTTIDGKEGKDQIFKADKEADIDVEDAMMLEADGTEPKSRKDATLISKTNQSLLGSAVKFRLDKNGEISKEKFFVMPAENVLSMRDDFGKDLVKAKDVDEKAVTFAVNSDSVVVIDAETAPVKAGYGTEAANLDGKKTSYNEETWEVDVDDFSIATWKDIKEDNKDEDVRFFVFPKNSKSEEVDGFVFVGKDGASTGSDEEAVYILDKWRAGDDVKVEYVKYPENKKEVRVIDQDGSDLISENEIKKERAYVAKEKSSGKLSIVDDKETKDFTVARKAVVKSIEGNYVKLVDVSGRLSTTNTLIYDEDNSKTNSFLKVDMEVDVVYDGVRARVIGYRGMADGETSGGSEGETEGVVTYINATRVELDVNGKTVKYDLTKDSVYTDLSGERHVGGAEIVKELEKGKTVEVVEAKGGVALDIQEKKSSDTILTEAEAAVEAIETAGKDAATEAIKEAKAKVAKVADKDEKAKLEARIAAVEKLVDAENLTEAEAAVEAIETAGKDATTEAIKEAKDAVAKVADKDKKAKLEAKIAAVEKLVAAKEEKANLEAAKTAVDELETAVKALDGTKENNDKAAEALTAAETAVAKVVDKSQKDILNSRIAAAKLAIENDKIKVDEVEAVNAVNDAKDKFDVQKAVNGNLKALGISEKISVEQADFLFTKKPADAGYTDAAAIRAELANYGN